MSNPREKGRFALSPDRIIIHEDWNPHIESNYADLSLLDFGEEKVYFTAHILPICMLDPTTQQAAIAGVMLGWTRSGNSVKRLESKLIQINKKCPFLRKDLAELSSRRLSCVGMRNRSNVCFGENGGSLSIQSNETFYLKGISTSLGNGCNNSKTVIYTELLPFRDWIEKKTRFPPTSHGECSVDYIFSSELLSLQSLTKYLAF